MKPVVFTAELDSKRNVLRVSFYGVVTGALLEVQTACVSEALKRLQPGFLVVADLTELDRMDLDCAPALTAMMDLYVAAEVGRVIRVIPDPGKDIGLNILSITHYRGRVPIVTCETRAEAEEALGLAVVREASQS